METRRRGDEGPTPQLPVSADRGPVASKIPAAEPLPDAADERPAIPAAKNWLGDELLYRLFARRSVRRQFDRVWLQVLGPLPDPKYSGPLILYLNHSSWWDGYMMYLIHRVVLRGRYDVHLLMEEKQLRSYRFFTWSGAFSVNRHDPEDALRAQRYAARLLRARPNRALFIFPQGKIVPNDQRPLVTYPGIARIVALAGEVTLCPVALRYEFLGQQWPHAFIRIGPAHRPANPQDQAATLAEITSRLTAAVDALRDDVVGQRMDRFAPLLQGRRGIDKTWDAVRDLLRLRRG